MDLQNPTPVDLLAIPEPWGHNPSRWRQRVPIAMLGGVAFIAAAYMGLYQWGLISWVWDPFFGDQTMKVLDSDVSHKMTKYIRLPDAMLGAIAYLGDILFAMAGSQRRWQFRPWLVIIFGIDVIPLGIVGAVLVVMQGAVVGSWCTLCLLTAAISLILVVLAYDEVWSCLLYLWRVWKRSGHDKSLLWRTLWGQPSELAHEVAREIVRRHPKTKKAA